MSAPTQAERESPRSIFVENFSDNALGPVRTLGRTFRLAILTVLQTGLGIVSGRLKVREAVVMGWYLISVTAIPAFLMAIPFGIIVTIQIGNIINQLGAQSLLGAASGFAVIQQAAPLVSGVLLGGAGASAIAADLGSRTVREEIDAMRTMGIDPIERLVVPRVIAAAVVGPLLALFIITVGVLAAFYLAVIVQGVGRQLLAVVRFVRDAAGPDSGDGQGLRLRGADRRDRLPAGTGSQGRSAGNCRRRQRHGRGGHGGDAGHQFHHHADLHGLLPDADRMSAGGLLDRKGLVTCGAGSGAFSTIK